MSARRAIADLVDSIIIAGDSNTPWAVGTVTTVDPFVVNWNGVDVPAFGPLQSYTPGVGDVVLMARYNDQLVVLGAL